MTSIRTARLLAALAVPLMLADGAAADVAGDDGATSERRFDDAAYWASVFDDPGRDAWQKPRQVVDALAIRPGDVLADIGAGTGYFNAAWSRAVGPQGAVFAVEVEPSLVEHLRDRAEREATENVVPVLASKRQPRLPPAVVDLAVLVNTYHHIDQRVAYFRAFRRFLAPGGRLAVLDWRKQGEIPVGPPPEHRLSAEQVRTELAEAGYTAVGELDFLPHQYGLIFRVAPGPP